MYDARTRQDLTVCGEHIVRTMSCVREHEDVPTVDYLQPLNAVTVETCEACRGSNLTVHPLPTLLLLDEISVAS